MDGGCGRPHPLKGGGKRRARVKDGLIIAVFRHYESRAAESKPLLHDHALISIRARRPDDQGTWGNLSADSMLAHIVAADTPYLLYSMKEVSARLGWAWEPREVSPGRRPVMEIAGIDRRLIGWQSTRRRQIEDALPVLTAKYEERQGHALGQRAAYALAGQAADQTRPPKRTEMRSLTELRERWRTSAIRAYGPDVVDRLAQRARAAAAAVWARVWPVVDITLAAVDVVAVVYVTRGAFARHHLLAEARRHLSYVLRGRPHQPALDERIVQTAVDDHTRPVGRGRRMTADLRALYPSDTEDQAMLRPLTRSRAAARYERARLAPDALAARVRAARRAERLGSRTPPVRRRGARRLEVAPAAVPRRPEGRPPPGAGDRIRRRRGGADPSDPRSRRRAGGGHAPGQSTGTRSRPRPASAARPGSGPAAAHPAARHPEHTGPEPHWRSRVSTPEERPNPTTSSPAPMPPARRWPPRSRRFRSPGPPSPWDGSRSGSGPERRSPRRRRRRSCVGNGGG
ncbi:MobF family relaxase [Streptomyces sp. NPDC052020]|uniref:MobF family relaxase n=1 Tax=Streptomyces sp. NPDC052020 TaxID=3155677 RepID=UPI003439F7C7